MSIQDKIYNPKMECMSRDERAALRERCRPPVRVRAGEENAPLGDAVYGMELLRRHRVTHRPALPPNLPTRRRR